MALPTMNGLAHFGIFLAVVCSMLRDVEARCLDGAEGRAIAFAADHEPVDAVHAVLLAGKLGVGGPDVLDEEETATGSQYPA